MAIIKPFKGIRPPKELVEQVASRPYDVLNSEEAREEAKGNESHFIILLNRKLISLPEQTNTILKYMRRLPKFPDVSGQGLVGARRKRNYYVYAQTMNGKPNMGWW